MKTTTSRLRAFASLIALLTISFESALATPGIPCGNQSPYGPSEPPCTKKEGSYRYFDCAICDWVEVRYSYDDCSTSPGSGSNLFSAYTGNAHRAVLDLSVFGSVGEMPLNFVRYSNTRMAPQSSGQGRFGREGVWTHSYQWFLRDAGLYSNGQPAMRLGYPDGRDAIFVQQAEDLTLWLPPANARERIVQNGAEFTLQTSTGEIYKFDRLTNAAGAFFYRIKTCEDGEGNVYSFAYNNATDTLLRKVSDPSGRSLTFTYVNQGPFAQQRVTLGSVPYGTDVAGTWREITVTNTTACRFLTLYYSNDFHNAPALPVGEIEFYDTSNILIAGTPFGSDPLSPEPGVGGPAAAFDNDTATYYRYAYMRNGYVGIDLGAGVSKTVGKIRYFIPGSGVTAAAQFIGMNETASANWVIKEVKSSDGRKVIYDYNIFTDASGLFRWGILEKVTYPDSVATDPASFATYTYTQTADYTRPILSHAIDPRLMGKGTDIAYEFDGDASLGYLRVERSGLTGEEIAHTDSDGAHKPKAVYPGGRVVKFEHYLSNANLKTYIDPEGRVTNFTYQFTNAGHIATKTDAKARVTLFETTPLGSPIKTTLPEGRIEEWTYDARERVLTKKLNGPGIAERLTTYTRDPISGRVTRVDYPDGSFETFTYDTYGQVLEHRMRNGGIETNTYAPITALRTTHTDAAGRVTTFTYDAKELVASATLAVPGGTDRVTQFEYDDRGQVTKVTYPDAKFVTFEYDAFGNQTARVDELGHRWETSYDEFRRRESSSIPARTPGGPRPTTLFDYDEPGSGACCGGGGDDSGNVTKITLPSGKKIAYTYDLAWRKKTVTVAAETVEAATTTYEYDETGALKKVFDGRLNGAGQPIFWLYTRDAADRVASVTDPLGNVVTYTYDAAGSVLTTKREGHDPIPSVSTYDALGRLVSATNPKGETVQFAYGGAAFGDGTFGDNLVRLTDARNKETHFEYDALNRRLRKVFAGGTFEQWTYDVPGDVETYRTTGGQVLTSTYDLRGRALLRDWSDSTPDVSATYDDAGRVLTLSSSTGTLSFGYNDANDIVSETQDIQSPIDLPAKTVTYTYDADGNRAGLTYPDGFAVAYGYNQRNLLAEVTAGGPPPLATYFYDAAGLPSLKTLENGTSVNYTFDAAARLKAINHHKASVTFQRFDYTVNVAGLRTAREESNTGLPAVTDSYVHDDADQLAEVKYNHNPLALPATFDRKVNYDYDPAGNRQSVIEDADGTGPGGPVTVPYTANDLNQYTAIDGLAAPLHDDNGNLTRHQPRLVDPVWNYSYDAQNRLISGTTTAGGSFTFAYDARNRCVARTINSVTTLNVYDGWSLIEERSPTDTSLARYIHGGGVDEILARITTAGTVYYQRDGLGSTTALTDNTGTVVERVTYDAYGLPSFLDGSGQALANSAYGNRLLFTGREWFADLRLNDHRNRYYSPDTGRWLSRDPIEEEGGINLYGYVGNGPGTKFDPQGFADYSYNGNLLLITAPWWRKGNCPSNKNYDAYMIAPSGAAKIMKERGFSDAVIAALLAAAVTQCPDDEDSDYKPKTRDKKEDTMGGEDSDPFKGKGPKKGTPEYEKARRELEDEKRREGRGGRDNK